MLQPHHLLEVCRLHEQDGLPLPSFHIDPQAILKAATPNTKIIFLCSPGNPTANALRTSDILTILNDKVGSHLGRIVAALQELTCLDRVLR